MKKVLFYSLIFVFLASSIVTLLGLIGRVPIPQDLLSLLTKGLLIEVALAVIASFSRADFFSNDEKEKHAREVAELKQSNANEIARLQFEWDKKEEQWEAFQRKKAEEITQLLGSRHKPSEIPIPRLPNETQGDYMLRTSPYGDMRSQKQ